MQPSGKNHSSAKIGLQHILVVVLATFAVLHGWVLWRSHDFIVRGYEDFTSFYTAGKIVQRGQGTRLYDRQLQWQVQQEFASSVSNRTGPLPYIRPPFEALLFLPLACLSYPAAVEIWTLIKLVLLISVFSFLPQENWRQWPWLRSPWVQGILSVGFLPVVFDLVQGQDSIPLLLVVTVAFFFLRRGEDFRSGACLGLGLFKFHLILPLFLIFLIKRRTRVVLGFVSVAVLLFLISLAVVGWSALLRNPKYLWDLNQSPNLLGTNGLVMPNLRGLLSPFLRAGRVPVVTQIVLLLIFALGMASMAKMWEGKGQSRLDHVGFSYSISVLLLTSYYTTSYDMTLLLIPLHLTGGLLVSDSALRGWPRSTFVITAGVLLLGPLYWMLGIPMVEFHWTALVLLAFTVSLAGILKVLQRRAALQI